MQQQNNGLVLKSAFCMGLFPKQMQQYNPFSCNIHTQLHVSGFKVMPGVFDTQNSTCFDSVLSSPLRFSLRGPAFCSLVLFVSHSWLQCELPTAPPFSTSCSSFPVLDQGPVLPSLNNVCFSLASLLLKKKRGADSSPGDWGVLSACSIQASVSLICCFIYPPAIPPPWIIQHNLASLQSAGEHDKLYYKPGCS